MSARILVVDDIEANVRLLQAKLEAEYYEVATASDGPSGLAAPGLRRPRTVLGHHDRLPRFTRPARTPARTSERTSIRADGTATRQV